ncbi:hypothetical protein ISCGN_023110 [Ixodes scapularis]
MVPVNMKMLVALRVGRYRDYAGPPMVTGWQHPAMGTGDLPAPAGVGVSSCKLASPTVELAGIGCLLSLLSSLSTEVPVTGRHRYFAVFDGQYLHGSSVTGRHRRFAVRRLASPGNFRLLTGIVLFFCLL